MLCFKILSSFTLVATILAAPNNHWTRHHRVFERSLNPSDKGWKRISEANPFQNIHLRVALKESGDIWKHLWEVSDPGHPRYGQHVNLNIVLWIC